MDAGRLDRVDAFGTEQPVEFDLEGQNCPANAFAISCKTNEALPQTDEM
jgi:hypothetical protein